MRNVAIICKRFYALTMMKELGVTTGNNNNSKTYKMINITNEDDVLNKHTRFLNRCTLCVTEETKCLQMH